MSMNMDMAGQINLLNIYYKDKEPKNQKWYMVLRLKRIWILTLIPISFLILVLVRYNQNIAEYVFARGIYKIFSQGLSLLTGIFPFSIMEMEIVVVPILFVCFLIHFLWRLINRIIKKQGGISYMLSKGILNIACIISVILFQFVVFAGVNYYRYSFSSYSGLQIQNSTVDELYGLCLNLAHEAADIRGQIHKQKGMEDKNGAVKLKSSWNDITKTAKKSFQKLSLEYPVLTGDYGSTKPVFFSKFMSQMEITGIFWPFTVEANVNVDTSDYSIPATMGHEIAHVHGFMREDEANFISYLACKKSNNLEFRYSGIMLALSYASDQLYKEDASLYNNVRSYYSDGMNADLREEYFYWKGFEDTVISTISNTVNDSYLKVNNQHDGAKSYGRMVDLLLAEYKKENK